MFESILVELYTFPHFRGKLQVLEYIACGKQSALFYPKGQCQR